MERHAIDWKRGRSGDAGTRAQRILVLALIWAAATAAAHAAEPSGSRRIAIAVRTYVLPVKRQTFSTALSVATSILERAGVDTDWVSCGQAGDQPVACRAPLERNELAIRVLALNERQEAGSLRSLGFALIDTQQRTGTLATVYFNRVQWLAHASATDEAVLLGRAMAHEIGHLLIGTDHHSANGLMRAIWRRNDLAPGGMNDWFFSPEDVIAIRNGSYARELPR
jgi:hypothetical protein